MELMKIRSAEHTVPLVLMTGLLPAGLFIGGGAASIVAACACGMGASSGGVSDQNAASNLGFWLLCTISLGQFLAAWLIDRWGRRFRAEHRATRDRDRLLGIAAEGASIAFWERDLRSGTLDWDRTMHRIYGTDPALTEPTSELWARLVHPEDIEQATNLFERAIRGQGDFDTSFRVVTPAGATRTVRTAATVVRDHLGQAERVVGANWDVSELAHTARRLEETATRLALAMGAARIGLWDVTLDPTREDLSSQCARCDETLHQMLGYEPGELDTPSTGWHAICHPDDLEAMRARCRAHLDAETQSYSWDYRVRSKSGEWVWIHDAGEVVERDTRGRATRMMGVRMLIDEAKRTEDALRAVVALPHDAGTQGTLPEIARALAEAFDVAFVGVSRFIDDERGPAAELIAGWHRGDAVDTMVYPLAGSPCDHASRNAYCFVERDVCDLYPDDRELVVLGAESYAGVVIHDSRGSPIGVLHMVHDRPMSTAIDFESILRLFASRAALEIERNAAEDRLRSAKAEAERANLIKGEFLANVSHEIRTPIQAMIGFSDLLAETREVDASVVRDFASTISRNGSHLLTLVNDLLDSSKIEAGQMRMERIETRPSEVIGDVGRLMGRRIQASGLSFGVVCETPIPEIVRTDPTRLRQVLVNLVGNALKFTERGSITLRVRHDADGDRLAVSVEDTGIGIEPDRIGSLFRPFTQADSTTTRRFGGTGLGLSISRRLSELMGGGLTVQSEPGRGSVFCAEISAGTPDGTPMIEPDAFQRDCERTPEAPSEGPVRPALHALRVLLVEDSADNRRLLAFHLERAGASVVCAEDGRAGLSALAARGGAIDLIVTDMQMPEMDGYAMVRAIRSGGGALPIVALTANATSDDERRCLEAGCTVYETKPVTRARLVRACLEALEKRGDRSGAHEAA
jgi:PAS domain S-box-containing protein